jgi:hypothetical protein
MGVGGVVVVVVVVMAVVRGRDVGGRFYTASRVWAFRDRRWLDIA